MTLEILILILVGVVVVGIIEKYLGVPLLEEILLFVFVIPIVLILLLILLAILTPFEILTNFFLTQEKCEKNIVRNYDQIFYEANSKKKVKQALRRIDKYNKQLNKMEEKRRDKEILKFLKSVKWAL